MSTVTVFKASPDKGVGLAHDMRIRWALEEVGRSSPRPHSCTRRQQHCRQGQPRPANCRAGLLRFPIGRDQSVRCRGGSVIGLRS